MRIADKKVYLAELCDALSVPWPKNETVNIVCHGHSVPSGYACTPVVDTFNSYPHLAHKTLKQRFPFALMNWIVTAIGGENVSSGAKRFSTDVLPHKPKLVTVDYSLNDRGIGLEKAESAWRSMIETALNAGIKVMLMTPSWDQTWFAKDSDWQALEKHAQQVRRLAGEYSVALADSFSAFERYIAAGGDLADLLSHVNHPSPVGHTLIAREISSWFPAR